MEFDFSMDRRSDDEVVDLLIQAIAVNITGKETESGSGRTKNLFTIKQASSENLYACPKIY